MLADDVTEMIQQITHSDRTDSARHALPAWREIHAGISAAERYLLDDSVAAAAQNVAFMKPSSILEAIGFARLPHGRVWVEWLEKARKEIVRAHGIPIVEDSETRPQPRRVGFLLETTEGGRGFKGTVVWSHADGLTAVSGMQFLFYGADHDVSPDFRATQKRGVLAATGEVGSTPWMFRSKPEELAAFADLSCYFGVEPHKFAAEILAPHVLDLPPHLRRSIADRFMSEFASDVAHEWLYATALILLLQARNGVERRPETYEKLNKSRVKKGKTPYFTHEVVTMRLGKGVANAQTSGHGVAAETKRLHVCSGHFKRRAVYPRDAEGNITSKEKTEMLVWWSPHLRGDAGKGLAQHKYVRVTL